MTDKTSTLIYSDRVSNLPDAEARDGTLWLTASDLEKATGWSLKPEGFCRGPVCTPVPPARRSELIDNDRFNLVSLAKLLGQPVVHDEEHAVWCIGEAAAERKRALTSLEAPDFTLPDLDGQMHSLSDHRGKKVLLVSWASW